KAAGGCGTVMMFGSAAASSLTPIPPNHVNLWQASAEPGLRAAARAIKAHGALAFSQVTSSGRRSYHHLDRCGSGPSATVSQLSPGIPHVLSVTEIRQMADDSAPACRRLKGRPPAGLRVTRDRQMRDASGAVCRRLKACRLDGARRAFSADQLPDQFWSPAI